MARSFTAIDRGAANAKLMRVMPDRTPYRLRRELLAGDGCLAPTGSLTELHIDAAPALTVSLTPASITPAKYSPRLHHRRIEPR